jgi:hypothetical protein
VDLDRPAAPLWWLIMWPFRFIETTAANLRGKIPAYLRAAGFHPVERRGCWLGLFAFWIARKPG